MPIHLTNYLADYLLTCLNTTTTVAATATTIITFIAMRRDAPFNVMGAASSLHTDTALIVACDDDNDDGATPTLTPTPASTPTPTATPTTVLECMRSLCGLSIDKSHRQRAVAVVVSADASAVAVVAAAADSCIYCFARPLALHGVKRAQSTAEKKKPIEKPQVELECAEHFFDKNLSETILRLPTPTET